MSIPLVFQRCEVVKGVSHDRKRQSLVLLDIKSLCEQICELVSGLHIDNTDSALLDLLANEEVLDLDVLALLMILGILGQNERPLVVPKECGPVHLISDRIQQILDEANLTARIRESHELSVLRGTRHSADDL